MNWADRILLFATSFVLTTALSPIIGGGLYIGSPW